MTVEALSIWLETTALRNMVMVAIASTALCICGLCLSGAFRHKSAALRSGVWQLWSCGLLLSTVLILTVDGVALRPAASNVQTDSQRGRSSELALPPVDGVRPNIDSLPSTTFTGEETVSKTAPEKWSINPSPISDAVPTQASEMPERLSSQSGKRSTKAIISALWIVFSLAMMAAFLKSIAQACLIVHRSTSPDSDRITRCFDEAIRSIGLNSDTSIRLLQTEELGVPFTFGFMSPTVVIPTTASDWPSEKLTMVLAHEVAHVQRRDLLWHWVSRFAFCFTGFNPLTWLAQRQSIIEREQSCDDRVLDAGFEAPDYGQSLLEVAATMNGRAGIPSVAVSMAQPPLKQRLETILSPNVDRRTISRKMLSLLLLLFLVLTAATGILRPFQQRATGELPRSQQENPDKPQAVTNQGDEWNPLEATDAKENEAPLVVKGTVTDLDGRPIAAAIVKVDMGELTGGHVHADDRVRTWNVTTDAQGNYEVLSEARHTNKKKMYFVVRSISATGYAQGRAPSPLRVTDVIRGKSFKTVQLREGRTVKGRIMDADGNPIAAIVKGAGHGGNPNDSWWLDSVDVGPDGALTVSVPSKMDVELLVYAEAHAARRVAISDSDTNLGELRLSSGTRIRGQLVDLANKPVPGVAMQLESKDGELPKALRNSPGHRW